MRRSTRVLLAATVGLLASLGITAMPAFASQSVSATINRSCDDGQNMTSVQFKLTKVPEWQKITIRTNGGSLTRDHNSFESTAPTTGTARYDIALDSQLTGDPAIAYISDDDWTGGFWMTGATCAPAEAAQLSGQGSPCGSEPQVSIRITNPNPVTVTYQVGGQLSDRSTEVGGGQSENLVFSPVERGRDYRMTAEGSDGTASSASVNVPACTESTPEPSEPSNPTTSPPEAVPTQDTPVEPGVPTSPTTAPTSMSVSAGASVATSTSASAQPSTPVITGASASPVPVPTTVANVDPFEPLLQAEADASTMTLAAPVSATKELFSNNLTLVVTLVLILIFLLLARWLVRRRPNQDDERN